MKLAPLPLALAVCFAPLGETRSFAQLTPSVFEGLPPRRTIDFEAAPGALNSPGSARLPLFGMTSFLQNPLDIDDEDDPSLSPLDASPESTAGFVFSLGAYRPNFDLRPASERRAYGYVKSHSQMQVAEVGTTSLFFTVQSLSPGDNMGVSHGPTSVSPSLGLFHDLGAGAAVQGYLGQDVYAHSRWVEGLGYRVHCGVGVQCPVPGYCTDEGQQGWFFFLQARGYYRYDDPSDGVAWKVVPGVHWRANENCWLSVSGARHSLFALIYRY